MYPRTCGARREPPTCQPSATATWAFAWRSRCRVPRTECHSIRPSAVALAEILVAPPESPAPVRTGPRGRSIADVPATRKAIYTGVLGSFNGLGPVQAGNYTLTLPQLDYEDPEEIRLKDKKKAILRGDTLSRRIRGTMTLHDQTGKVVNVCDLIVRFRASWSRRRQDPAVCRTEAGCGTLARRELLVPDIWTANGKCTCCSSNGRSWRRHPESLWKEASDAITSTFSASFLPLPSAPLPLRLWRATQPVLAPPSYRSIRALQYYGGFALDARVHCWGREIWRAVARHVRELRHWVCPPRIRRGTGRCVRRSVRVRAWRGRVRRTFRDRGRAGGRQPSPYQWVRPVSRGHRFASALGSDWRPACGSQRRPSWGRRCRAFAMPDPCRHPYTNSSRRGRRYPRSGWSNRRLTRRGLYRRR